MSKHKSTNTAQRITDWQSNRPAKRALNKFGPAGARQPRRSAAAIVATAAAGSLLYAGASNAAENELEEVIVTGYRASLISALDEKRASTEMVDVINAEDIASFPDANLAESLQRLPGVSIDRENGEGNTISVRGLGGDFTRVRLNGLETLSTSGATQADGALRRDRAKLTLDRVGYMCHPDWVVSHGARVPPVLWRPKVETRAGLKATAQWHREQGWP